MKTENQILRFLFYQKQLTHLGDIHYEPVYAPDDLFCENDPVSFVPVDYAQEHIKQFITLMNQYKDEGYELDVFMM
jgi:8-oxo-dGTP pyrophosphatase MutT (NUDIX family)